MLFIFLIKLTVKCCQTYNGILLDNRENVMQLPWLILDVSFEIDFVSWPCVLVVKIKVKRLGFL